MVLQAQRTHLWRRRGRAGDRVGKQEGLRGCQLEIVDAHAPQDTVPPLEEKAHVQNARLRQADSNLSNGFTVQVQNFEGVWRGDGGMGGDGCCISLVTTVMTTVAMFVKHKPGSEKGGCTLWLGRATKPAEHLLTSSSTLLLFGSLFLYTSH